MIKALHKNGFRVIIDVYKRQGQYNFPRAKRREAIGAMYFSLSEFIQASTETAYLLNETYMPFYKWKIRGMETFRRIPELCTLLEGLMQKDLRDTGVEKIIEQICRMVVGERCV